MLDAHRPILFWLFFALALGCREDVPIGFIILGVYLMLVGRRVGLAMVMTAVSVAYFIVVKGIIMPSFGSWWFNEFYKDLYPAGENSYGGIIKTLLTNPVYVWKTLITTEKMILFLLILTPLAFMPLRRGLLWMSLLAGAPFTFLTTGYWPTVQISFQYVLLYIPFIFTATVLALAAYYSSRQNHHRMWGVVGAILVSTVLVSRVWGAMPPGDRFRGGFRVIPGFRPLSPEDKRKLRDLAELAALMPKGVSLAASETEHPHLSTRLDMFALRAGFPGARYILYSEDSGAGGADMANAALARGEYEVVQRRPASRLALLKKKDVTTP
jgi:uncharacterized membrane protein